MYLSSIGCQKDNWYVAFAHKRLRYRRDTAGTFVLDLLYRQGPNNHVKHYNFSRLNLFRAVPQIFPLVWPGEINQWINKAFKVKLEGKTSKSDRVLPKKRILLGVWLTWEKNLKLELIFPEWFSLSNFFLKSAKNPTESFFWAKPRPFYLFTF